MPTMSLPNPLKVKPHPHSWPLLHKEGLDEQPPDGITRRQTNLDLSKHCGGGYVLHVLQDFFHIFPHVLSSPQLIKINFSAIIKCVKLFIGDDTFLSVPIFQKLSKNVTPFPFSKRTFFNKVSKISSKSTLFPKQLAFWPLSQVLFSGGKGAWYELVAGQKISWWNFEFFQNIRWRVEIL